MKVISAKELSERWKLEEDDVYRELLHVVDEFKDDIKRILINHNRKEVFIVDAIDIEIIGNNARRLTLSQLSQKFGVTAEQLKWVIQQLYVQQRIGDSIYRYYMENP